MHEKIAHAHGMGAWENGVGHAHSLSLSLSPIRTGGKTDFPLVREETTIGRKDDNHISLPCAKISKYHAVIKKGEQGYYLRDRNSSNGVKVNDKLISQSGPQLLNEGDKIDIGTFTLYFHDERRAAKGAFTESGLPTPPGMCHEAVAESLAKRFFLLRGAQPLLLSWILRVPVNLANQSSLFP